MLTPEEQDRASERPVHPTTIEIKPAPKRLTMATHTPGPWILDAPSRRMDRHDEPEFRDYHHIDAGVGFFDDTEGFGITGFMSEADARLITAAPDLLAACKRALGEMRDYGGTEYLRAAIKKAEPVSERVTFQRGIGAARSAS